MLLKKMHLKKFVIWNCFVKTCMRIWSLSFSLFLFVCLWLTSLKITLNNIFRINCVYFHILKLYYKRECHIDWRNGIKTGQLLLIVFSLKSNIQIKMFTWLTFNKEWSKFKKYTKEYLNWIKKFLKLLPNNGQTSRLKSCFSLLCSKYTIMCV